MKGRNISAVLGAALAAAILALPTMSGCGDGGGPAGPEPGTSPGSLDASFGKKGKVLTDIAGRADVASAVSIQSDGKIVAAGYTFSSSSNRDFAVARYDTGGSLDTSFQSDGDTVTSFGGSEDIARAVALQPDGKIVAAGYSNNNGSNYDFALARYGSYGNLDASFDSDGKTTINIGNAQDVARAVALQPDGKIVAAGYSNSGGTDYDFALARFNSDGSLDTGFDSDGKLLTPVGSGDDYAFALALQPDGKIVAAGYALQGANKAFALVRYESNGALDGGFGTGGKTITSVGSGDSTVMGLGLQTDGKLVAVGHSFSNLTSFDFSLARYGTGGVLDPSFGTSGKVVSPLTDGDDFLFALVIQSTGNIVVAGQSENAFVLARYDLNGSLDTRFGQAGKTSTRLGAGNSAVLALAIQPDGKIVAAGYGDNKDNNSDFALARYLP